MPEPRPRTPAQIEASRRNGARSRGPVTPGGKARASRNALKHGLTAMTHMVIEGEAPEELEALTFRLVAETGAVTELEARLVRRLALAFWKGDRSERMEAALLKSAPRIRPPAHGWQWEEADPLTTFDVRRFNAIRGAQAQIGREIGRCLKELRELRNDALHECTDEPEPMQENEPERMLREDPDSPPPANDDAPDLPEVMPTPPDKATRNEPDGAAAMLTPAQRAVRAEMEALVASGEDEPDLTRLTELTRALVRPRLRMAGG